MKNLVILVIFLLCIFLGACSGGSSSRSTRINVKVGKPPRDCQIQNGKGQQTWNRSLKKWNKKCEVTVCNAGYDDYNENGNCVKTKSGHYSPAGSKERTACTGKPKNSSWAKATGLVSTSGCVWACHGGYDDHDNDGDCEETITGYYSPTGTNQRTTCPTPAHSTPITTQGLTTANECFTCNKGYDDHDDDGDCDKTITGYYSPAGTNQRTTCPTPTHSTPVTTQGLTTANECFTCNKGYDDHDDDGDCDKTITGYYSPAGTNQRTTCPIPAYSIHVTTQGLTTANECFTCNKGYDDHDDDGDCDKTITGYYSPAETNQRTACPTPAHSTPVTTQGLTTANECFTCNKGYDDHDDDGDCDKTITGYYSPAGTNQRTTCPTPAHSTPITTQGLTTANECFTCNGGYDNFNAPHLCLETAEGYYSPTGSKDRMACNGVIPPHSTWAKVTGLTALSECNWACHGGYDDHDGDGDCEETPARHYSLAGSKDRIACTSVTKPNHSSWDTSTTGLSSARECWTCDTGAGYYKPNKGNICAEGSDAISASSNHICVLLKSGAVKCWGLNLFGETIETPDLGGSTAKAITTGSNHSCAILQDGTVKCWGNDTFGQIGSGTPDLGGSKAEAITAGYWHTCALLQGGTVKCWGGNTSGQRSGDGKRTGIPDIGMSDVDLGGQQATHISAGESHTCAVLQGGTVKCWGDNFHKQSGGTDRASNAMVTVDLNGAQAKDISTNYLHTCALLQGGGVKCWGKNQYGQTGRDISQEITGVVDMNLNGAQATAISAGWRHTCALLQGGGVKCWGENIYGEGVGSGTRSSPNLGGGATAISAGHKYTCVLMDHGAIKCWGWNIYGKVTGYAGIGVDEMDLSQKASQAPKAIAVGISHTCAILKTGVVTCWGSNENGETAGGTPNLGANKAIAITAGYWHTCALLRGGALKCWGYNKYGQTGHPDTSNTSVFDVNLGGSKVTAMAGGKTHTCAILQGGTVRCWGGNVYGQLGIQDKYVTGSVDVNLGGKQARAIVAGESHTCALLQDNNMKCWGGNYHYQRGGTNQLSQRVVDIPLNGQGKDITAGESHTCALLQGGGVKCWGLNNHGQTGAQIHTGVDNLLLSGKQGTAIAAGSMHNCIILNTGEVKCWGQNNYGQTGGASKGIADIDTFNVNLGLLRGSTVTAIAAGAAHTCAILNKGTVKCWGTQVYGPVELHIDLLRTLF